MTSCTLCHNRSNYIDRIGAKPQIFVVVAVVVVVVVVVNVLKRKTFIMCTPNHGGLSSFDMLMKISHVLIVTPLGG